MGDQCRKPDPLKFGNAKEVGAVSHGDWQEVAVLSLMYEVLVGKKMKSRKEDAWGDFDVKIVNPIHIENFNLQVQQLLGQVSFLAKSRP